MREFIKLFLRELMIFAIVKDWLFWSSQVTNVCDFREVEFNWRPLKLQHFRMFLIKLRAIAQLTSKTTCRDVKHSNPVISVTLSQLHRALV